MRYELWNFYGICMIIMQYELWNFYVIARIYLTCTAMLFNFFSLLIEFWVSIDFLLISGFFPPVLCFEDGYDWHCLLMEWYS